MKLTSETKVGSLVLSAIAGLGWLTYQSGDIGSDTAANSRVLSTEVENASGLFIGSKVKMAGVNIGIIREITLTSKGTALLSIAIDEKTPLPENVSAKIDSNGLIGEKFISLTSPMYTENKLSEDQSKIPFVGTSSLDDIGAKFSSIASDLNAVSTSLRSALAGQENQMKLQRIVSNLDTISGRLNVILNEEIEPGKVNNIVNNFSDFSTDLSANSGDILSNVKSASASLNRILNTNEGNTEELITNFTAVAKNLNAITSKLTNDKSTLGQLINKDTRIIDNLDQASMDIASVSNKIASGQGTIGRLVNDEDTINKIESALDSLSGLAGRVEQIQTEIDFYGYSILGQDVSKGRFDLKISPRPNRFYLVGVTSDGYAVEGRDPRQDTEYYGQDFGNKIKFTAQFGQVYENALWGNDLYLRFGIRDSAFGLGVDTFIANDRVKLSADLYDFGGQNSGNSDGSAHLDLTGRYFMQDLPIYGIAGIDNALNSELAAPFVGLGMKFNDEDFKYLLQTVPTGGF
jgi:phospholipid/cholesterol/gamma-HCH transport system substrate-binding protein